MLVKVYGSAVQGIDACVITIEVQVERGIKFFLVGLPDSAVRESHERIVTALQISGFRYPTRQIIINMAPADVRKEGAAYDLPLAVGILAAVGEISADLLSCYTIMGELSLDGSLMPLRGALSMALKAKESGFKGIILPKQNMEEAAVVSDETFSVYGAADIRSVTNFLNGDVSSLEKAVLCKEMDSSNACGESGLLDFRDVCGQDSVKRAIEVAASGAHNLIMIGPPGSGKSMMATRINTILPPLTMQESLETTRIHSVAGKVSGGLIRLRPFRAPHHTISSVALVGGGANAMPGEISLACNGVLFLDELPEFSKHTLDMLRQPLEDGKIRISRVKYSVEYPADFMLIASMNPCPCGYYNHPTRQCTCSPGAISRYLGHVSGPLLDRFDIQVQILPVSYADMCSTAPQESSAAIRERVMNARQIQLDRFAADSSNSGIFSNSQMTSAQIRRYATPDADGKALLGEAMERLQLSARAYSRILKVARTIADMESSPTVSAVHIAEAIGYRTLDRSSWGT